MLATPLARPFRKAAPFAPLIPTFSRAGPSTTVYKQNSYLSFGRSGLTHLPMFEILRSNNINHWISFNPSPLPYLPSSLSPGVPLPMPLLRRPWPCSRRRLLRCRRYAHGPRTTMNCAVIALSCEVAAIVPSHVVVAALHKAAVFGLHDPCCRCCYAARTRVHRRCATISTLSEKKLGTRLLFNIS